MTKNFFLAVYPDNLSKINLSIIFIGNLLEIHNKSLQLFTNSCCKLQNVSNDKNDTKTRRKN